MSHDILLNLTLIIVIGIGAQWLAWRLRIPSILLLLVCGFTAGPILGLINPDELVGEALMPLVSLAVAMILYEGGLTLRISELKAVGGMVRNLITIGALVTWLASAVAAKYALDWPWNISILLGAILSVTGPTVIMPLLRHVKPEKDVRAVLKWEGILIDPVGALLAVLVFEAILVNEMSSVPSLAAKGFLFTLLAGGITGAVGALCLHQLLKRFLIPDFLQNPLSFMAVIATFTAADSLQHESGLLAVTVMGILLANQKDVAVHHLIEFKENLRVLFIGALFVLLSARLTLEELTGLDWTRCALFLACLLLLVRPLSVFLSGIGSPLSRKKKLFLAWMAPRGIVAAAVSSLFALRLQEHGVAGADQLVPVTFVVIVATVAIYGLTASPVATALGLSQPNPQGILIIGGGKFALALATSLKSKFDILIADTNWEHLYEARKLGLRTYFGSVLSEHARNEIDLGGIGRMLALTPNPAVNELACQHMREFFGRSEVYQLPAPKADHARREASTHLGGRVLFNEDAHHDYLEVLTSSGSVVKMTPLSEQFDFAQFKERYGSEAIPLGVIGENEVWRFATTANELNPKPGETVVCLVKASQEDNETATP